MKNVASKSSALFSVIPDVTSLSSEARLDEHSGVSNLITSLMGEVDKAEGNLFVADSYLWIIVSYNFLGAHTSLCLKKDSIELLNLADLLGLQWSKRTKMIRIIEMVPTDYQIQILCIIDDEV